MQCCGDSFAVGDEVAWTVREVDAEWLQRVFGPTRLSALMPLKNTMAVRTATAR